MRKVIVILLGLAGFSAFIGVQATLTDSRCDKVVFGCRDNGGSISQCASVLKRCEKSWREYDKLQATLQASIRESSWRARQ